MKPKAIEQAEGRLAAAERARDKIGQSSNIIEMSPHWADFILAAHGVYMKLFAGSLGNAKSGVWYKARNKERKKDPLLLYLHRARDVEEHGLDSGLDGTPFRLGSFPDSAPVEIIKIGHQGVTFRADLSKGPVRFAMPTAKLVAVIDERFGPQAKFDVPTEHLGRPLFNNSPHAIAMLGCAYLRGMVEDAKRLVSGRGIA